MSFPAKKEKPIPITITKTITTPSNPSSPKTPTNPHSPGPQPPSQREKPLHLNSASSTPTTHPPLPDAQPPISAPKPRAIHKPNSDTQPSNPQIAEHFRYTDRCGSDSHRISHALA
ncbi:hypothetical protein K490DRAFT_62333 [Saccharata proteae CBS 121410]|uniref:Uncharacterized protein n=1 Tax=Saccharata proteae CBS 121410 TaxID=1314787 RepID=A0A9P4M193_9PEZI|nr:hypothetical protein K490DRAFT_62333 [Saccharata proteae CBS 121410]